MLLLYLVRIAEWSPVCLGKSCSFGLLYMSFLNVYQMLCVSHFPFGIECGMWDVIVLIPDHCISIYFDSNEAKR